MSDQSSKQFPHLTRDFVGYGKDPVNAQWPNNARVALNIVLNYEEGSEPSIDDGDGYTEIGLHEGGAGAFTGRDLGSESMYEYGSRVGIWRIFRILRERNMPATVFATAVALERNPAVAQAIREYGFDVCSHGRRWIRHQDLTPEQEKAEIGAAYDSITKSIGRPPAGWYCRYAPTLYTRSLVVEHGGFAYDSDAYNDDLPYWTKVQGKDHLVIPYTQDNNDGKFCRGAMATANDFFEYLRDGFDLLYEEGAKAPKMMSVGLHLRLIGHPGRAVGLARFLDHVASKPQTWVCGRADIANHWRKVHLPKA